MQTLVSRILIITAAVLTLISVPAFPSTHHSKSSSKGSGGGSSHGGRSHFSSKSHSYTHSSLSSGRMNGIHVSSGHMFSSRTSGKSMTSARINSTHLDSTVRSRGQSGLARMDTGRTSGSSAASRYFARSGASQPMRSSASARGDRDVFANSFVNSSGRTFSAPARVSTDSTGGNWHSFGNAGAASRPEIRTGYFASC